MLSLIYKKQIKNTLKPINFIGKGIKTNKQLVYLYFILKPLVFNNPVNM